MRERLRHPWPRFELVTLTGGSLPPHLAAVYPALTVPGDGIGACKPRAELALTNAPDGHELICFADCPPVMVNSSLNQFVATVREATARFPFHSDNAEMDLLDIADSLRAELEPIDPPAWYPDRYWDSFYWDVSIGDYSPAEFELPP